MAEENRLLDEARFDELVSVHQTAVQAEVARTIDALGALGGLYDASSQVDRREFSIFAGRLLLRLPELRALEWLPRVESSALAAHVAEAQEDGLVGYSVRRLGVEGPLEPQDLDEPAWPVRYVEPLEPNRAALGFDVSSERRRRGALLAAVQGRPGTITATEPISLVQTPGDALDGVLLFRAVRSADSTEVLGAVLGVIDLSMILRAVDPAVRSPDLEAWLVWQDDDENRSLALRASGRSERGEAERRELHAERSLHFPGLQLGLTYEPAPSFYDRSAGRPWWVLFAGALISLLVAGGLKSRGDHAARLRSLASQLADANENLQTEASERERAEAAVRRLNEELQTRVEERTAEVRSKTSELGEAHRRLDEQAAVAATLRKERLESLGLLAGGVAHDFNNLLTAILGQASFLRRVDASPTETREAVAEIELAAQRAAELVRQLLAYAGRADAAVEVVRIPSVLSELSRLIDASISKKASLELDLDPDIPPVEIDATQLRQIFMNLITNASDALEGRPGTVRVRAREVTAGDRDRPGVWPLGPPGPGSWVSVSVEDDGRGMSATSVERMFEPFFTTKEAGHGLGLSAVLGIVKAAGGRLRVRSSPGDGTEVELLLRRCDTTRMTAAAPPSEVSPTLSAKHVLVVDDEAPVRTLVTAVLRSSGCEVTEAGDGVVAIETLRETPHAFDAVLLDMVMPRMDGPETLAALRELRPDLPVVLSTGFSSASMGDLLDDRTHFLAKPYRARDLLGALEEATEIATDAEPARGNPPSA